MRIVLDTNCLIQSISPKSAYHDIWLSILNGKNTLCVSNEILEEYAEILNRLAGKTTANLVLNAIIECRNVMFFTPYYRFNLISADPDDNKFVDCAISGNAEYIVSNDSHFRVLNEIDWPRLQLVTIQDYVKGIGNNV